MHLNFLFIFLLIGATLFAQVPAMIPYQAVARNAQGQEISNAEITVRFSLRDQVATGVVVWQEIQTLITNSHGLFSTQLGSNASLSAVNWGHGRKFMQVEIDFGIGMVNVGIQELLNVPYAIHGSNGFKSYSQASDTLLLSNGQAFILPNAFETMPIDSLFERSKHSCGFPYVHNPEVIYGNVVDHEGNSYKTVDINGIEWMAENLKVGSYRNGDGLAAFGDDGGYDFGAAQIYSADPFVEVYHECFCPFGRLYNWYAVNDSRGICPAGWRIPTVADFESLQAAGSIISDSWSSFNSGVQEVLGLDNNSTGFSALPGGYRYYGFAALGSIGTFWTSQFEFDGSFDRPLYFTTGSNGTFINNSESFRNNCSVRCVKE